MNPSGDKKTLANYQAVHESHLRHHSDLKAHGHCSYLKWSDQVHEKNKPPLKNNTHYVNYLFLKMNTQNTEVPVLFIVNNEKTKTNNMFV